MILMASDEMVGAIMTSTNCFSQMVSAVPKFDGPNWWVDATASMDGDGSFSAPFKFIEDAIHRVGEYGDTIRLQAGTYVENNLFLMICVNFTSSVLRGGAPTFFPVFSVLLFRPKK